MLPENDRKRLRTDEEEEGKYKNQESDETEEGKTEGLDRNGGQKGKRQNDEENVDDEEEEEELLEKENNQCLNWEFRKKDVNYDYDCDYHQNLAILRTMRDYKSETGNFPHPSSLKLLDFIMYSLPNLKISREKLAKKIIAFKNNYNDAWELDGDNPRLDRPVDRDIFNLSKQLWGNKKEFYDDWKWK